MFKVLQSLGIRLRGCCIFNTEATERRVDFNALNTQFSALYLRPHEHGYEPEVGLFIDAILSKDAVFIDIGSNWGYFAIWVASQQKFKGRVLAFEPVLTTFHDLVSTVENCGLCGRIECHNVGLSNHNGGSAMVMPDFVQSGAARLRTPEDSIRRRGTDVRLRTLDSFNLDRVDLIKVDVEGHEEQVFEGGIDTLSRTKPFVVFENGRIVRDWRRRVRPMEILEELGYIFFYPCWVGESLSRRFFMTYDDCCDPDSPDRLLGLVPTTVHQRLLYEGNNIIACHRTKVALLDEAFNLRS